MNWKSEIRGFESYLKLERGLSQNSISAYLLDVRKLAQYLDENAPKSVIKVSQEDLLGFIASLNDIGIKARSQARIVSGLKGFFKYLLMEKIISVDPSELIESPKLGMKLPVTLTVEEIEDMFSAVDLSSPQGARNRTMLELLYGCGLRVSELTELKISQIHFNEGFIQVIGKGNKERLVPFGGQASRQLKLFLDNNRRHVQPKKGFEDHIFLNKHGRKISRVTVFNIIKKLCERCEIKKNVSPHTFRHSFATHLVHGGADLRAVQEMLGHESITTTEIYTHLDRDFLRTVILDHHPRNKK